MQSSSFERYYIAMAVQHDKGAAGYVDKFLDNIPKHLIGQIILACPATRDIYTASDRWMPVFMFLASHWKGHHQFTLTIDGEELDVTFLYTVPKPNTYRNAKGTTEEDYRVLRQQELDRRRMRAE